MENQPTTGRSWFRLTSLARGDIQPQALTQAQTTPAPTAVQAAFPRTRLPVPTTQPATPQPQPPRTPTPPQPQSQPQSLRAPTPPPPQPQLQTPRTPTPLQPQSQPQSLRAPTPPPPQPQLQTPRTPTPPPAQTQNAPRTPTPPPLQTQTAPRTPTPPPLQTQTAPRTPTPPLQMQTAPRTPTPPPLQMQTAPRKPTPTPPPPPHTQNGPRAPTPPIPQQSLRVSELLRSLTQQETPLAVTNNAAAREAKEQPLSAGRETMSTIAPIPRVVAPTPSRSPTPPQSPKVITTSFPTQQSPRTSRTLPPTTLIVNPEPEPKTVQMPAAELKSITASNGSRNSRSNASLSPTTETTMMGHPPPKEERRALDTKSPPPNSKEDKSTVTQTSKKFNKEMSIINLAGQNMGAHMEMGYRKLGQKEASGPRTLNEKATEKKDTKAAAENAKSMASLVNSNVQCINNSLLLNSSCTQKSPGVHITLSRHKPKSSNSTAHSPSA